MVAAFIADIERSSLLQLKGLGIKGAYFFRYDNRHAFKIDGLAHGFDTLFNFERFDEGDALNPDSAYDRFYGDTIIPIEV